MIIPLIGLVLITLILNNLLLFNETSRILMIIKVAIIASLVGMLYLLALYKLNILNDVFGSEMLNKIKNKFIKKAV